MAFVTKKSDELAHVEDSASDESFDNESDTNDETEGQSCETPQAATSSNILCASCHIAPRNLVFKPCQHVACCRACWDQYTAHEAAKLLADVDDIEMKCPICKGVVKESDSIFFS